MKRALAWLLCSCALGILGCGGTGTLTGSSGESSAPSEAPTQDAQGRPEPEQLIVKNLKVGSGPAARRGDQVAVLYIGLYYESGEEWVRRWGSDPPLPLRLGSGRFSRGWEEGIVGMRVGGRRKLTIPARLTDDEGPLIYYVKLVRLKPGPGD